MSDRGRGGTVTGREHRGEAGVAVHGVRRGVAGVIGWLTGPIAPRCDARDDLLATVVQRRPAVYISCATIMIMSVSAALLTGKPWAATWLAFDTLLIAYRLYLSFRYDDGVNIPTQGRAAVVGSMFVLFIVFGVGCSLCILDGPPVLMLMAVCSVLGVFAGIGTRWAALPRLALLTVAISAVPVCTAIALRGGGGLGWAAVQFAAVAVVTVTQAAQNHRTLVRMIVAERQTALLARSDPLTGLGNRVRLREDLDRLFGAPTSIAVMYLDLDGFKTFNDTYGHDAGDALLVKVGDTLRLEAGEAGVYRMGGDEFVVVCERHDEADIVRIAKRIIAAVPAVRIDEQPTGIGVAVSIGIALAEGADAPEAVLTRADEALYAAKRAGKARCHMARADALAQPIAA